MPLGSRGLCGKEKLNVSVLLPHLDSESNFGDGSRPPSDRRVASVTRVVFLAFCQKGVKIDRLKKSEKFPG